MIVYGRNAVREALRGSRTVKRLWATKNARREPWLTLGRAPEPQIATSQDIERRCASPDHQGICAEVSEFAYLSEQAVLSERLGVIVALDQVQDPQNLGAVCRTAECAGVSAVVLPERRSALITPAVCKASAGAVEHLAVGQVRNLADFLKAAQAAGRWCYGADAGASRHYDEVEYGPAPVLVLGSEGHGLRPRVAAACDELVSIPLRGRTESLSVSAAAAVLIFALTSPVASARLPPGR